MGDGANEVIVVFIEGADDVADEDEEGGEGVHEHCPFGPVSADDREVGGGGDTYHVRKNGYGAKSTVSTRCSMRYWKAFNDDRAYERHSRCVSGLGAYRRRFRRISTRMA